ncbi:hypothetical protein Moror_15491 [Moniliophthora roreri MCA 2997]|uniref:Uncharacterized protein n=2 Tax=Moniliophthora roreri TaxID=221103 RepID=V2XS66_MONRO|nr:hypothetical protein Moror_15491 [Moniliophthora roreri MCA 2997]
MKQLCRSNAVSVSQSWAQAMSDTTGMAVTIMLGGTPLRPSDSFQIENIHAEKNKNSKNWSQHDKEFQNQVTKNFHFLQTCPGAEFAPQKKKKQRKGHDEERNKESSISNPTLEKAGCSSTSLCVQPLQDRAPSASQDSTSSMVEHGLSDPLSPTNDKAESPEGRASSAPHDPVLSSSSEAHHVITKEGGPNCDP